MKASPPHIEPLEPRIAPAGLAVSLDHKRATWTDVDGDLVTFTSTKPILDDGDFHFLAQASGDLGYQLAWLELNDDTASGAGLTFTARRDAALHAGDGFVNIGWIDARGSDLALIRVDGDLARLDVGDSNALTSGVGSIIVHSAAGLGTLTQGNQTGSTVDWLVKGKLGTLNVKGDFFANLNVIGPDDNPILGAVGSITILGNLVGGTAPTGATDLGSGYLATRGPMGPVKIYGDVFGGDERLAGSISSGMSLASVYVGGSIIGSRGNFSGSIFSAGTLGSVFVGGSIFSGPAYDDNGTIVNPSASGSISSNTFVSKVTVLGSVAGGGSIFGGSIFTTPGFGGKIGTVTIAGTLSGGSESGTLNGSPALVFNGIYSDSTIGSVKVGSMIGRNAASPVHLIARGVANPTDVKTALAIGSVTITRGMNGAEILAGFGYGLVPENPDVQIGVVKIGTTMVSSSIVAGTTRGADFFFGNDAEGAVPPAGSILDNPLIHSRIGSVTVSGYLYGVPGAVASFAIQAQELGAIKIGPTVLTTTPNTGFNAADDFLLAVTHDVHIREVA